MSATPKQKKKSKFWPIMGITATLIVTALCFLWRHAPDKKTLEANRRGTTVVREAGTGYFDAGTAYPGVPLRADPDENITIAPVMATFEWELAINGFPARRFPVGKPAVDLIDMKKVGRIKTATARVMPGQGVEKAQFVYVKHRSHNPPSGWFDAALNTRR